MELRRIEILDETKYYKPEDFWKVLGRRFLIALIISLIGGLIIWKIWFSG